MAAASAVTKVVNKCEDAKENNQLDLHECKLTQVPEAVYFLLKEIQVESCCLSCNLLKKLPAKFCLKFSALTVLDLSRNQLQSLPEELENLQELTELDVSHNHITSLPTGLYMLHKLRQIKAQHNQISELQVDNLEAMQGLQEVSFEENPLLLNVREQLQAITVFTVRLSDVHDFFEDVD